MLLALSVSVQGATAEEAGVALVGSSVAGERDSRIVEPLPDFTRFDSVAERKRAFFAWLRPVVETENRRIMKIRQKLDGLDNNNLSADDQQWLRDLFYRYRVPISKWSIAISALKRYVDAVPVELTMAQAANESGWGTSRFARKGNNLFGQWCFKQGCGMVPGERNSSKKHEVRVFATPAASVRAYMYNLNSNRAYEKFRTIRVGLHRMNKPLSAEALAVGLLSYSSRGQAYVDEIRDIIRANRTLMQATGAIVR